LDLNVQYEDCSFKSSANDYDYTSHINDKLFRNSSYLRRIKFEGHYDSCQCDASELRSNSTLVGKRRGESFTKTVTVNGKTETKTYYRYLLMIPINHGLAQEDQVLPAGVHVRLTFHRASPKKAVINVTNSVIEFGKSVIDIIDPTFHVCWAYSPQLDQQMSKIAASGLEVPFESGHIRHRVLDDGLMEHNVSISQGKLPKYIVFFLMSPERFGGDLMMSSTKFQMYDLNQFALMLDNDVIPNYPLRKNRVGTNFFYHEFYRRWLTMTERYGNTDDDIMDEASYIDSNFMIVERFEDLPNDEGHLSVKLIFDKPLPDKLLLCWMPVTDKSLNFDRNLSVQLQ